jgi:hypothetical protein
VGAVLSVSAQLAQAQGILIPKPAPHTSQGQLAGASAGIAGDFTLMGAQMLANRWADSGGAYLFENGNTVPRQTFRLTNGATLSYRDYAFNPLGEIFSGQETQCTFTEAQVNGAYLGDRVAISSQWVALASHNMGHNANAPYQLANCAGAPGIVPAVYLAKRNASGAARPYGYLDYSFNAPFRERIHSMAVSNTDLVMVTSGWGAHIFSYNASTDKWSHNRTVLHAENLNPSLEQQVVAIDGNVIVIGDKDDRRIFVYRKSGSTWSHLVTHTLPSVAGFGRAVNVKGNRIIVGSNVAAHIFDVVGSGLSTVGTVPTDGPLRLVAIQGGEAVGVEDNQADYIWRFSEAGDGGMFYRSGGIGGIEIPWVANNLSMDGIRVVAGAAGYNQPPNNLIGAVVWDAIRSVFVGNQVTDDAEGPRLWHNAGPFNWQRHSGPAPGYSTGTGPSGGAGGSGHYYFVETSQGDGAYYSGQTALLETGWLQSTTRVEFDFHMWGDHVGQLHLEVFSNGQWSPVLSINGQQTNNRSQNWQSRSVALTTTNSKLRFRYVANGGARGDVALDNIRIKR